MSHVALTPEEKAEGRREWREGWRLVLAGFAGCAITSLPTITIGLFTRPLGAEFGWSKAGIAAAASITGWTIALSSPFIGGVIDRFGVRRVGLTGAITLPIAIACLSLVGGPIYSYWAVFAAIALAQTVCNVMIWTIPVGRRFVRHRGIALALVLSGTSLTGTLYPTLATLMIEHWGWRTAYVVSGAGAFLFTVPLVWLYLYDARDLERLGRGARAAANIPAAPERPLTGMTRAEAMRTRQFWQMLIAVGLASGGAVTMYILLVPIGIASGVPPLQAASAVSLIALTSLVAKPLLGGLIDRVAAAPLVAATVVVPGLACLLILVTSPLGYGETLLAAFLIGIATGAEMDMVGVLAARYFGTAHYGRIYGLMSMSVQMCIGVGPILVSLSYDRLKSYDVGLSALIAAFVLASVMILTLGKPRYFPEAA